MWLPTGAPGDVHLVSYLEEGRALSRRLAASIRSVAGEVFAVLPQDADPDGILQFESGALVPPRQRTTTNGATWERVEPPYEELGTRVRPLLTETKGVTCLLEDFLAAPTDPFLSQVSVPVVTLAQDVFYVLGPDDIPDNMSRYFGWHSALAVGPTSKDLSAMQTLSMDDMDELASAAQIVAIQAYDVAGFLAWVRSPGAVS